MKKLFCLYILVVSALVSCQKDDVTPSPDPIIPNPIDTTDTVGDTTTIIDSTLHFDFAVNTQLPTESLDSVVIIHYVNEVHADSITLLRSNIGNMSVDGGFIYYNSNMVRKPNSIELSGSGNSFYIKHYLNAGIGGSIYNFFELGTTNSQTASESLVYSIENGKHVLQGYSTY